MASQFINESVKRRLHYIACHLGAHNNEDATSSIHALECSSNSKFQSRRRDSMLLFSRQGSESYSHFMRQESIKQMTSIDDDNDKLPLPLSALGPISVGAAMSSSNVSEKDSSTGNPLFGKPAAQKHEQVKTKSAENEPKDCQHFLSEKAPLFARVALTAEEKPKEASSALDHKHLEEPTKKPKGPEWVPRMDVLESGTEYVLLVELPGVSVEGIRVEVDHGRLIVTGSRSTEWWKAFGSELTISTTVEHAVYHQRVLTYGPYRTVWQLPENVDMNAISAEFVNGILTVLVPKLKSATFV